MVYLAKTPDILKPLAGDLIWSLGGVSNKVYLTFDDGPTPGVTDKVLDILDEYGAKATFFCIGGNVSSNPKLYQDILARGHRVGNHTWNHMNGWQFSDFSYLRNTLECAEVVDSDLFRPPYGRIKRSQVKSLKARFKIIMWDVLPGDWIASKRPEDCLATVKRHTKPGSIIVFHDSIKAKENVLGALPATLEHFRGKGWECAALP